MKPDSVTGFSSMVLVDLVRVLEWRKDIKQDESRPVQMDTAPYKLQIVESYYDSWSARRHCKINIRMRDVEVTSKISVMLACSSNCLPPKLYWQSHHPKLPVMLVQVRTIIKFENGGKNLARYKSHADMYVHSLFLIAVRYLNKTHLARCIPPEITEYKSYVLELTNTAFKMFFKNHNPSKFKNVRNVKYMDYYLEMDIVAVHIVVEKSESGYLFAAVAIAAGTAAADNGKAYSVAVVVGTSSLDDASPLTQPPPRGTAASLTIVVAGTAA
ncbi:hypothetical protein LXL04_001637 [Taraxacum kok-saghyz]